MAKNKSRLTPIEGQALAAAFVQSKLKPKEFCKRKNIPYHVLHYWRKHDNQNTPPINQSQFFPVTVVDVPKSTIAEVLTIKVGSNLSIEVPSGIDPLNLKQVLEVCLACG